MESNVQEKNREVLQAERKQISTKKVQASTDHKVEVLEGKLKESRTNLAQALSIILAKDNEIKAMRRKKEQVIQLNYNLGFDDTKNSASKIVALTIFLMRCVR